MTPAAVIVVLTTLILAQAPRAPLLAGPKVTPEAAVDTASGFSAVSRRRPPALGPYRWRRLLQQVDLDAEQRAAIRVIIAEFRSATEAFRDAHGERFVTLKRQARETQETDRIPPEDRRLELNELREMQPKRVDYLKRIWALLDHQQRQRMRHLITEARRDVPRTSG